MKKKIFSIIAVLLVAALALTGCGGGSSDSGSSSDDGAAGDQTLNFGCYVYSTSCDPATEQNSAWDMMRWGVGEGLFKFDSQIVAQPNLCDTYEKTDDLTWVFHIRDGVQFSNGNACDAQAVADSLNRLYNVCADETMDQYTSTPAKYLKVDSITADTEANTVTIVTSQVYANVPGVLCFPFYAIIDVQGDDHYAGDEIIGTGPYAYETYDATTKCGSVVRNEYYWNGEVPYERINVTFIEDAQTKSYALQSGDVDLTENITSISELDTLRDSSDYYVSETAGVRTGISYINHEGILANDTLRHAVMMACDGPTISAVTVGGMYTYGYAVLPSNLSYDYDSLVYPDTFSLEGAAAMLDEAGIVDTDGDGIRELDGENINLLWETYVSRSLSDMTEACAASLQSIGIGVTVSVIDSDTLWNHMMAGEYDLSSSNWQTVGVGEPDAFLQNWYGDGGNNLSFHNPDGTDYCGYVNAEYDALMVQLMNSTDPAERADIVIQMEQILLDDAAVLVHGYYNSNMCSNSNVVAGAEIASIDYYWITNDIRPAN